MEYLAAKACIGLRWCENIGLTWNSGRVAVFDGLAPKSAADLIKGEVQCFSSGRSLFGAWKDYLSNL